MTTATEPRAVSVKVIRFPSLPAGVPHLLVECTAETAKKPVRKLYALVRKVDSFDVHPENHENLPYSVFFRGKEATHCDCAAYTFRPERYAASGCKHMALVNALLNP